VSFVELVKVAMRVVAHVAATPFVLSFALRATVVGRDRAIQSSTQLLALVPGLTGQYLRRAFLTRTLDACHHTAVVEFGTTFSQAGARLDARVYIGPGCHVGLVHVERDVLIGAGVHIPSGSRTHRIDDPTESIRNQPSGRRLVRIGAGSWIGAAAVVMADVGSNSIVGAGAVVTRSVPNGVVAAGVPSRVLHMRGDRPARRLRAGDELPARAV
jgi:acetyltransferase-like isoleucine patch superfamily enzyme